MKQLNAQIDDQMLPTYQSLATRLIERYNTDNTLRNNQLFVGIAGGPGSGKSTLAAAVADILNSKLSDASNGNDAKAAVVLPMDGFHYTRSQLQSMGNSNECPYSYQELLARRGAPWTFDAESCTQAFIDARENAEANLPIYSREKSDPVPNGVQLCQNTKIVLLEGNYLLAWKDERWSSLRGVFDETWFVCCQDVTRQRQRLVLRHLETWSEEKTVMWGEGEVGAGKKADANDMLNLEWIESMSKEFADFIVESL
jgi:pantothenate kinase